MTSSTAFLNLEVLPQQFRNNNNNKSFFYDISKAELVIVTNLLATKSIKVNFFPEDHHINSNNKNNKKNDCSRNILFRCFEIEGNLNQIRHFLKDVDLIICHTEPAINFVKKLYECPGLIMPKLIHLNISTTSATCTINTSKKVEKNIRWADTNVHAVSAQNDTCVVVKEICSEYSETDEE